MKKYLISKIILLLGLCTASGLLNAQLTESENYVQSVSYLDYTKVSDASKKRIETVLYLDGLGRPRQTVNVKASPQGKDVVTHQEYDNFGRQVKDFLPVPQPATLNGGIVPNSLANATQPHIYGSEKIYSDKKFENSPLNRLQEQTKVGNSWAEKPARYGYSANTAGEVRKYSTSTNPVEGIYHSTLSVTSDADSGGFYKQGTMFKNTVQDEDGNLVKKYTNSKGQLLLERRVLSPTENADTYYIYSEYDQLAYIIPPKAAELIKNLAPGASVPDAVLNDLCYQYKRDSRDRIAEKKLPGKGWEYMIYDGQDRLVGSQDANLRAKGHWLYIKYDYLGRVAITGISMGGSRLTEQNIVKTLGPNNVNRLDTVLFNRQGMNVYYGNPDDTYPDSSKWVTLLSLNYYDTYPAYSFNPAFPQQVYGKDVLTDDPSNPATAGMSTNGLQVMSFIKNIEDDSWTRNINYYDARGRIVSTYSMNHLGGYTKVEKDLDFTGLVKQSKTYHKRLRTDTERIITESYDYDNQNRLLVQKHQVDSNPVEILAQNYYNELSQVETKMVGGEDAADPLQTIDYTYNIQGWLTKVNDPQNLGNKLFGYELKFNNPANTDLSSAYYNGNIAEIDWKAAGSGVLKRYSYQYDPIGRLTNGIYSEPNTSVPVNNYYNEALTYDLNGNVSTLKRNRYVQNTGVQLIDHLNYAYTGNRLETVTDISGNYQGYPDTSGAQITYDSNANMTSQVDKGILQIDYNFLNLPTYIKFNESVPTREGELYVNTKYIYNSEGVKLRKVYNYFAGRTNANTFSVTDYLDGFQYNAEGRSLTDPVELQFIPTEGGYYDFKQNKYFYQYKDQVGNIRLAYYKDASGNVATDRAVDYYPFGLEFAGELITSSSLSKNYLYGFQEQEKQRETGWHSFKWRNYDPVDIRFFNVDPLAEKYAYQSPFNFSENKVTSHRELEGLEAQSILGAAVRAAPGAAAGAGSSKSGVYETAKRNAINNYNGIIRLLGNQAAIITTIGSTGIGIANRVMNSEGDSKAESKAEESKSEDVNSDETGIIYKRKEKSGKEKDYVGQAKDSARYKKRQREHQRANKDADYEFEEIDRGKPGKDLDKKEQKHIDEGGGPTNKSNPDGGLQNKRNQIKQPKPPKNS